MSKINSKMLGLSLSTVALMTACGGSGGDSPVTTTPTTPTTPTTITGTDLPTAVQQTASAVIDFAKAQLAASSDSTDPVRVGDATVVLATDDTAEPAAL